MSFVNLKEGHWTRKIWSRISNDFNLNSVQAHHFFCSEWEILPEHNDPTGGKLPDHTHSTKDSNNSADVTNLTSSAPRVSLSYLIYRGVFMLILLSSITFSTSCQSHLFHLFLTNWSFTSQNVYGILLFFNVLWRWWIFKKRDVAGNCQKTVTNSSSSLLTLGNGNDFQNSGHHNPIILEMGDATTTTQKKEQQTFWTEYKNPDSHANGNQNQNQPDVVKSKVLSVQPYLHENGSVTITTNVVLGNGENYEPQIINQSEYQNGYQQQEQKQESCQNDPSSSTPTPTLTWLEKAIWILLNVVHVLPYCVVLGYWLVVYKYDPDQPYCEKFRSHYIVHGATAVLAFLDAMIIAIPARPSHSLIPTGLVLFYVVFTCIYEAIGGPYRPGKKFIYSVLDWKSNPQKAAIFSVLAVIVTPIAHVTFCWGIYKLRIVLKSLYLRRWLRYSDGGES